MKEDVKSFLNRLNSIDNSLLIGKKIPVVNMGYYELSLLTDKHFVGYIDINPEIRNVTLTLVCPSQHGKRLLNLTNRYHITFNDGKVCYFWSNYKELSEDIKKILMEYLLKE